MGAALQPQAFFVLQFTSSNCSMSVCVYLHTGEGQRFEAQLLACSDLPQDWKKNISWSGASVSPLTNMG